MNNFARAHNSYLEPPDEPEAVFCEECGEEMAAKYDGMKCTNQYCPAKHEGVAKEMAEALVDAKDDLSTWKYKYEKLKREFEQYKENLR